MKRFTLTIIKTALFIGIISLSLACGSEAEIGESCETSGSQDECVENAICTNDSGEVLACQQSCEEKEDCSTGYNCNGISGTSLKSCQLD